jgi:hypothetical protein
MRLAALRLKIVHRACCDPTHSAARFARKSLAFCLPSACRGVEFQAAGASAMLETTMIAHRLLPIAFVLGLFAPHSAIATAQAPRSGAGDSRAAS